MHAPPPLALYVHLPWCVRKCPYCDFNSFAVPAGGVPEAEYAAALVADLERSLPLVWGRRVVSVFFGGGTPSLFSPATLGGLLDALRARLPLDPLAEITLEANPGAVEHGDFAALTAAGFNRLSLGIQSFHPAHLAALGRIHGREEALAAAEAAARHFPTFNLDLIHTLPGQTPVQAREDVATALACGAPHISAYQLTLEPGTAFHRAPPELPGEDAAETIQEAVLDALAAGGLVHYEVSAHALPGQESRHNLNYWTFGDYLGLGAGAHSKLTLPDGIRRQARHRNPARYLAGTASGDVLESEHTVLPADLPFEFAMNALRLAEGFDLALFEVRTGLPAASLDPGLARATARGLVDRHGSHVRPTAQGRRFLNDLLEGFLPD